MEILKQFGIQPTLLLAQIVNFAIILFLLKKFFYKPIIKVLNDRKQRIEESLQNAQLIEEKLQKTDEKSQQILNQARIQVQSLIDDAKKEAANITSQATAQARKIQEETREETRVQIETQKQAMQKQLEKETLNLVIEVVKKVLSRSLQNKERQDLTSKAISEISNKP